MRSVPAGPLEAGPKPRLELRLGPGGRPIFSLTLILERQPDAASTDGLESFVAAGRLSLEVQWSSERGPCEEAPASFARKAQFTLRRSHGEGDSSATSSGTVLASGIGQGNYPHAALACRLDRETTLRVLRAVREGVSTGLVVTAEVEGAREQQLVDVLLGMDHAAAWRELERRVHAGQGISEELIDASLEALRATGDVTVRTPIEEDARTPLPSEAEREVRAALHRMLTPLLQPAAIATYESDDRRILKPTPPPAMWVEDRIRIVLHRPESAVGMRPIEELLLGLRHADPERWMTVVVVDDEAGTGTKPLMRRVRSRRLASGVSRDLLISDARGASGRLRLLSPGAELNPGRVVNTDLAERTRIRSGLSHLVMHDALLTAIDRERSLPIVDELTAPVWLDRLRPEHRWYAEEFELLLPDPAATPDAAPFGLELRRVGATSEGLPALEARLRLGLRRIIPAATRAELQRRGTRSASPVPTIGLSASFELPWVDDETGVLRKRILRGEIVERGDDLEVELVVAGDWARLLYGALSTPGFQSEPPRLSVTYRFEAYRTVDVGRLRLAGSSTKVLPLATVGPAPLTGPVFDPGRLSVRTPTGEIAFLASTSGLSESRTSRADGTRPAALSLVGHRPVSGIVIQPPLRTKPIPIPPRDSKPVVSQVTHARQQSIEVVVPCSEYGAFYREQIGEVSEAIGCRDALSLGRTGARVYEELEDLGTERLRVFRNLTQPGRFLVLPATYAVTRHGPDEGDRSWRPVVRLHAVYEDADEARFVLLSSLAPAIGEVERRELLDSLSARHPDPRLEWPTDVAKDADFDWVLASGLSQEVETGIAPWGLTTMMEADSAGALLLVQSLQHLGLTGSARFHFDDGTSLTSALHLDLRKVVGPPGVGPLEARRVGTEVHVVNHLERPVVAHDLVTWPGPKRTAIDQELQPGGIVRLATPESLDTEAFVDATPSEAEASTVEELRVFLEDLELNVIFLAQLDRSGLGVRTLRVEARHPAGGETHQLEIPDTSPLVEAVFHLPMTSYLSDHRIEYRASFVLEDGSSKVSDWIWWDLEAKGAIVSLTADLLA